MLGNMEVESPNNAAEEKANEIQKHIDALLIMYAGEWARRFKDLDGKLGRPNIRECVKDAINHQSGKDCDDLKTYVESWLRHQCCLIR